jgi:hypothetical protein
MRTPRLTGILALAALALLFALRERRAVHDRREWLERSRSEVTGLELQIAAEQQVRQALHDELEALTAASGATHAALARAAAQRAVADPESRWANPPPALPEWNPDSPYLWIEKGVLTALPMEPFTASGKLHPSLAEVLAMEPDQATALTAILDRHLGELSALEAGQMEVRVDDDDATAEGGRRPVSVSVTLPPVNANPIRSALESEVREILGDSRADLVLHWGKGWLAAQFGGPDSSPRIFRVTRASDGTYAIATEMPGGSSSVSGVSDFTPYIPEHMRTHFHPLLPGEP